MNIAKIVREAREQSRLTALDFANGIFDEFIELHGDRSFRDDGAVIGGIGWLGDQAVTVVGIQKGKSLHDNRQPLILPMASSMSLSNCMGTALSEMTVRSLVELAG